MQEKDIIKDLFIVLQKRKKADPKNSYVASLYREGNHKINDKIFEEVQELIEASEKEDRNHLLHEIVDLLFHIFVSASHHNISYKEIQMEIKRRYGISGIIEKKNRTKNKEK